MVSTIDLAVGEVEDMTNDAADRSANGVQDTKRLVGRGGHDQNQRSTANAEQSSRNIETD
jgi:hypothetical protein